ncbi:hypothetical protein DID76_00350 [Candidatus Marinamargulisbacteria bacterium SCGC AG-414-C22]|nr:hypothetical protein DID76_00350 [Candidatus Marinamargulisbacteria bacterium SCGC AG-414-C22]
MNIQTSLNTLFRTKYKLNNRDRDRNLIQKKNNYRERDDDIDKNPSIIKESDLHQKDMNFDIYNKIAVSLPLKSAVNFIYSSKKIYNEFKSNLTFTSKASLNRTLFLIHWLKDKGLLYEEYKKLTSLKFSANQIANLVNKHGVDQLRKIITDYNTYVIPPDIQERINSLRNGYLNLTDKGLSTGQFAKIIESIPSTQKITRLLCEGNKIITLPNSLTHLTHLICAKNELIELPNCLNQLTLLICNNNQLTLLPSNLEQLKLLYCYYNKLTELPLNLHNLKELSCHNNKLKSLPSCLTKLRILICNNLQLRTLPNLTQLIKLSCSNNHLTSLPPNLQYLIKLSCDHNNLTSLPPNLPNLKTLVCNNNKLTCLPQNLQNLRDLCCSYNKLISLPSNLTQLKKLYCDNNHIRSIHPINPNDLEEFKHDYNPGIRDIDFHQEINNNPYENLITLGFSPYQIFDLEKKYGINHLQDIITDHRNYIIPPNILNEIDKLATQGLLYLTNMKLTTGQLSKIILTAQSKHPFGNTENITQLFCDYNNLTAIPDTLTNLSVLICNNNKLTTLPSNLAYLKALCCDNNHITKLPLNIHKLRILHCNSNPLDYPTMIRLYDASYRTAPMFYTHLQQRSFEPNKKRIRV